MKRSLIILLPLALTISCDSLPQETEKEDTRVSETGVHPGGTTSPNIEYSQVEFDEQNQYIGLVTPLDEMKKPKLLDTDDERLQKHNTQVQDMVDQNKDRIEQIKSEKVDNISNDY